MLEGYQRGICSSRSARGLHSCRHSINRPHSARVIATALKGCPERQRIQVVQAQSLQLAPQQQVQQLADSHLSSRPAANGVHPGKRRLKVAVDVDEGRHPLSSSKFAFRYTLKVSLSAAAVLGRFLHSLNRYCLETHGFDYDISDYSQYNFHQVTAQDPRGLLPTLCWTSQWGELHVLIGLKWSQIWGCTKDESNRIVHEFFKSKHFVFGVLPMPGRLAAVFVSHILIKLLVNPKL